MYLLDGSLPERLANAEMLGNHFTSSDLVWRTQQRIEALTMRAIGWSEEQIADYQAENSPPPIETGSLPSIGSPRILVILIDFPDHPHDANITRDDVYNKLFGYGDPSMYPYESLRMFYRRSSYNQLDIQGDVLGWYRAEHPSTYYESGDPDNYWPNCRPPGAIGPCNEKLIMEAIHYYDTTGPGYDFRPYDNDNDGAIEGLMIHFVYPVGSQNGNWAKLWWWYVAPWTTCNYDFTVDDKTIKKYVWGCCDVPGLSEDFGPRTDIHEVGHLLGLPDLYDYKPDLGPKGGAGTILDMMDHNIGDHNCFSKFMLDWITPTFVSEGSRNITLNPSGASPDCVLMMPTSMYVPGSIFDEFFMAQYRQPGIGNDPSDYVGIGMTIWHIDATLRAGAEFRYNNSYPPHKLVRLMEADGLEEIESEMNLWADAGDFYAYPKSFSTYSSPDSRDYAGTATGVTVDQISSPGNTMTARFSVATGPLIVPESAAVASRGCQGSGGPESCTETINVSLTVQNIGISATTNLTATLISTQDVQSLSGAQTYGVIAPGDSETETFSFQLGVVTSETLTLTLQLQDGATSLDPVQFVIPVSGAVVSVANCSFVSESCYPPNNAADPGEEVTIQVSLQNLGSEPTTPIIATLLSGSGVVSPSAAQEFGVLLPSGQPVSRLFTFTAQGDCGDPLILTFQVQDCSRLINPVVIPLAFGNPTPLKEDFSVAAPGELPADWHAVTIVGEDTAWRTRLQAGHSSCMVEAGAPETDSYLESPRIFILSTSAQLTFVHTYLSLIANDGAVLEIAVGTGEFVDILSAGGTFLAEGYNRSIAGRGAWSEGPASAVTTVVNLPPTAAGNFIRLRWRLITVNGFDWWDIESVFLTDDHHCCAAPPTVIAVTSVKQHGAQGEYSIDLPFDGATLGSECRKLGPTGRITLKLSFSQDIRAIDGVADSSEVSTSAGAVDSVSIAGSELTVTLTGVPDETCLTVGLQDLEDLEGRPMTGDADVQFIVLQGDIDGDGHVNTLDVDIAKGNSGAALNETTFRSDVTLSGAIDASDISMTKAYSGHVPPCVSDPGPWLHTADSRKTHGTTSSRDISLSVGSSTAIAVECRSGGPTAELILILQLSEPVQAIDGTIDANEVTVSAGSVTGVDVIGPTWLGVHLSGVANETCLTVGLTGLTDLRGHGLIAPSNVKVPVLLADVDSSLTVDQADVALITAAMGQSGWAYMPYDLDCDGDIDATDVAIGTAALNSQPLTNCP